MIPSSGFLTPYVLRAFIRQTNLPVSHKLVKSQLELLAPSKYAPLVVYQQHRDSTTKHWLIKWRHLRKRKFLPVHLPDIQQLKKDRNMGPDELRIKLKKEGMLPPRGFEERPINISSTGGTFEAYIPPEGDGYRSFISKDAPKQAPKQALERADSSRKSFLAVRKMKKYEEDFSWGEFAREGQEMYIESQNLLPKWEENEDRLHDIVTENAFPLMVHGLDQKTLRWRFYETIEPPRTVHVRVTDMMSKDNLYAQVTVRMLTKQTLAIYDRFGRLMYGSEYLVKDVLEYIVFEKHISDIYGRWRVHAKIIPPWLPPREPIRRTYRQPAFETAQEETPVRDDDQKQIVSDETGVHTGNLATA